jgi:polysaccharide biosynthesis/export protein
MWVRVVRFWLLLGCLCLFSNCVFAQGGGPADNSSASKAVDKADKSLDSDYLIGAEDVLAVNVWKEPDMSRVVPVRPDGKITLPLIGDIQASGMAPKQLQVNIENGLKAFVAAPEVTVIVQEVKSVKFNIVGEIARPGSYPLTSSMTVLDAIAVGGGLRDFAKASHIYVLRTSNDGSHSKLPFNYKQVIGGKNLAQNVELRSGDTIVIP